MDKMQNQLATWNKNYVQGLLLKSLMCVLFDVAKSCRQYH